MTELIPVLDLMSGMAVSGKSGHRDTYKPLKTIYSETPNPVDIAVSLKRQGFKRIYLADLDSIEGKGSNLEQIRKINYILPVILDWGVKDIRSFSFALDYAYKVIIATETLQNWDDLDDIFEKFPKERIIISVDIKDGEILSKHMSLTFEDIRRKFKQLNPEEVILLDISGVGTLKGFNEDLINEFRGMEESLILGGGITPEEIQTLNTRGLSKYLIGTALHSGKVGFGSF